LTQSWQKGNFDYQIAAAVTRRYIGASCVGLAKPPKIGRQFIATGVAEHRVSPGLRRNAR
jgi:hypothetical protein